MLFAGCSKDSGEEADIKPPTIILLLSSVEITGEEAVTVSGNELLVGTKKVATWKDEVTQNCAVALTFNDVPVTSGFVPTASGTLLFSVSDAAGNSTSKTIQVKMKDFYPEIMVLVPEVNVFGGVTVVLRDSELLLDEEFVAKWSDKRTEKCKVVLSFNEKDAKDGDILNEAGTLTLTVTNNQEHDVTAEVTLTCEAIYGMETKTFRMQVDKETNLLDGLTFAEGVELVKTELEKDGKRTAITDPEHFTPTTPGIYNLIFTIKDKQGVTTEVKVENLYIRSKDYKDASLTTANMIASTYAWYNNLKQSTKDFIYPHLIASYAACNWSKQDNRVHIIMGETPGSEYVENIGQYTTPSDHAYEGYYRIRALSPGASIK